MDAENVFLFAQQDLMTCSFSGFYNMKRNGELTDVAIGMTNRIFSAHRVILAAAIPYFRTMFTSNLAESREKEITMKDLDPTALETLIDFAYTSEVMITTENVQSLLIASEFLQITQVRDSCCSFLSKQLHYSNVMHVRALADSLNCTGLVKDCERYFRDHFHDFSQTKEFLNVSFSFLNDLIRRDDLRVKSEERVFEAVMCWVKADSEERNSRLSELLTGVRMTLLTPQYLVKKASTEKLILDSPACRNLLDEVKHYHLLPEERPSCFSFTVSQRCYEDQSHMYLFCVNRSTGLTILKYISETGEFSTLVTDRTRSDLNHVLALGDQIYAFRKNIMERFNPLTCQWTYLTKFFRSSEVKYLVPYGNRIYWLDHCYVPSNACYYEPQQNAFYPHQQKVSFVQAELVSSLEGIYILNGALTIGTLPTRKSIIYDPEKGKVTKIRQMLYPRAGFGCAVLDGKIYAFGGYKLDDIPARDSTKCTEVYSPIDGNWRTLRDMNTARSNFSLLPHNKKLYAFGGTNEYGKLVVRSIECYDPETDTWSPAGSIDDQYAIVKPVAIYL